MPDTRACRLVDALRLGTCKLEICRTEQISDRRLAVFKNKNGLKVCCVDARLCRQKVADPVSRNFTGMYAKGTAPVVRPQKQDDTPYYRQDYPKPEFSSDELAIYQTWWDGYDRSVKLRPKKDEELIESEDPI